MVRDHDHGAALRAEWNSRLHSLPPQAEMETRWTRDGRMGLRAQAGPPLPPESRNAAHEHTFGRPNAAHYHADTADRSARRLQRERSNRLLEQSLVLGSLAARSASPPAPLAETVDVPTIPTIMTTIITITTINTATTTTTLHSGSVLPRRLPSLVTSIPNQSHHQILPSSSTPARG
jgi:hypothetical protein